MGYRGPTARWRGQQGGQFPPVGGWPAKAHILESLLLSVGSFWAMRRPRRGRWSSWAPLWAGGEAPRHQGPGRGRGEPLGKAGQVGQTALGLGDRENFNTVRNGRISG